MYDLPNGIELRHFRAFVAVAEELNFTKAAGRLFIAQQALSKQIHQLEQRIGVQLVDRSTRHVELTAAGEALYPQARGILGRVRDAVSTVREVEGQGAPLALGFTAPMEHQALEPALEEWLAVRDDLDLLIVHGDPLDPSGGLRSGETDVAFVFGPFQTDGLDLFDLFSEELGVALAKDHPLAEQATVSIAELVEQSTFLFPTSDSIWQSFWDAAEYRDGVPISYAGHYRTLEGLVSLLKTGRGIRIATEQLTSTIGRSEVVWRPVPGLPAVQHSLAVRSGDERPMITGFVEVVRRHFARESHGTTRLDR